MSKKISDMIEIHHKLIVNFVSGNSSIYLKQNVPVVHQALAAGLEPKNMRKWKNVRRQYQSIKTYNGELKKLDSSK